MSAGREAAGGAGVLCAVLFLAAGCSTTSGVSVDHGRTDPGRCRSFDWLPSSDPAAASSDQPVKTAALEVLRGKGYGLAPETADCRITYALSPVSGFRPRPQFGIGLAGGSGGFGGGMGLSLPLGARTITAARLRLDVIDASGNVPLWSGWVDTRLAGPQPSPAEARDLVRKILGKFPDRVP